MDKNYLLMTVGLPGTGKTTFLQDHADEICAIYGIQHRLSSDDVIEETAQKLNATYTDVFEQTIKLASDFVNTMTGLLSLQRQNFIVDRTGLSRKSRQNLLEKLNNKDSYHKIAIVFNNVDPAEVGRRLQARAAETGKFIPPDVITGMAASFQYPDAKIEGFDAVMTVEEFAKTLPQVNREAYGEATFG